MFLKVKNIIFTVFAVIVIMIGALILPQQGLAEELTATSGNSISGTISLPSGVSAPSEGLWGEVFVEPENGDESYYSTFEILEGSNSAEYTVIVPEEVSGSLYTVGYVFYDVYPGFVGQGYYSLDGTIADHGSAALVDLNNGNATGINLRIYTGHTISGTISLPAGENAPTGGLEGSIDISADNGGEYYYEGFIIEAGTHSAEYTVTVPEKSETTLYRIEYYLYDDRPGYVRSGFYSSSGTTADYDSATLVSADGGNIADINLTIATGSLVSGTIALPSGEQAPAGGIEGTIDFCSHDSGSYYTTEFQIEEGRNSVNYTATVPLNFSVQDCLISYYLYDDAAVSGYLREGYYSSAGTTANPDSATLVDLSMGDVSGINLTILTSSPDDPDDPDDHSNTFDSATEITIGTDVSGQINPAGDIDFFKFTPAQSGSYSFTTISDQDTYGYLFDADKNQLTEDDDGGIDANFLIITQPLQAGQTYYIKVRMYSSDQIGNYQLNVTGNSTTPVPVSEVYLNVSDLTITVGEDEGLTASVMPNNVSDKSVIWTVSSESGSNVVTLSNISSDFVLVTAVNPGTAVIRATSNSDPAKYAEATITVINDMTVSGMILLPEGETAPAGGLEGNIYVNPQNGNSYSAPFNIPEGSSSANYAVVLPENISATSCRINYWLDTNNGEYSSQGYYSTNGTTTKYSWASLVDLSAGSVSGVNITLLPNSLISGNISLPNNMSAPNGGIDARVYVVLSDGDSNFTNLTIPEGENSASYSITIPAENCDYKVMYELENNYIGYSNIGYYSTEGTTNDPNSATLMNASEGNVIGVNIPLLTGTVVSGTITLPEGVIALNEVIEGRVYIQAETGGNEYRESFDIPVFGNSASYAITIPTDTATRYRVKYSLSSDQDFLREGYYSTNGTTNLNNATLISSNQGNLADINLTILTGRVISGTFSLPVGEPALDGFLSGQIEIKSEDNGRSYYDFFDIFGRETSASYSIHVPADASVSGYYVSYYLYNNNSTNYVREGYYSTAGVTNFNNATLVRVIEGNVSDINLTPLRGNKISGTISLPNGALASTFIYGMVNISVPGASDSSGGGAGGGESPLPLNGAALTAAGLGAGGYDDSISYQANFTIFPGENSASYTTEAIPVDPAISGYTVKYELYDTPDYVNVGYYSVAGTTNSQSATLVNLNDGSRTDINLTILIGDIISGTISLPDNATAMDQGIYGAVCVETEDGENTYFQNINIPSGANSINYSVMVPVDTATSGYRVFYYLYDNCGYVGEGYYSTSGTTTFKSATLVNPNAGNTNDINLTLLTGNTISGTVSLPEGVAGLPEGVEFRIILDPMDGGNPYSTSFYIDEECTSANYSATVPANESISGYRVSYELKQYHPGFIEEGYYAGANITTADSSSAVLVDAGSGDVSNINLTLLMENTLPSAIYLNKTASTLLAGQTEQFIATLAPYYTTDKSVTWSISSESASDVVALSNAGPDFIQVTALNEGTAVIRATSNSDPTKYAECTVTVTAAGDITALVVEISNAQAKHDSATEGTEIGQYAVGSKALLQAAIGAAQAIVNLGTPTPEAVNQAITDLTNAVNTFEAGKVIPEGFSATPVVEIGLNPDADDIAGMFIGLENIIDSENPAFHGYTIGGYQIEVTFDANRVSISDVLDATNSGALITKNIEIADGIGTVRVACGTGGSIVNYDKLFFIPITLKGSAKDPSSISVNYVEVRDTNLNRIQIPTQENLMFQRGRISNKESGDPNLADAIAGLQYLAANRNPGTGPEEVNLVNMASITENGDTNIAKASVKDIIALMQYKVNLRNDYFLPANIPQKIDFDYRIMMGSVSGMKLEIFTENLENGDLVQVLRGSDNSNVINPVTVELTNNDPLVIDNLNYDGELYLKLRITRGNNIGERLLFENMQVKMGMIGAANTTNIKVQGLQAGDLVSLYKESGMQIGGIQSVGANSTEVTFSDVNIVENGVKVQISRPAPASMTPTLFFKWQDLITFGWKTDLTANGLETITVQFLESGDLVNLFDSNNIPVPAYQGLVAGAEGKVMISDLPIAAYHIEVIRGGIHSRRDMVYSPQPQVQFGAGITDNGTGGKQLRIYDLKMGDRLEVLRGSDNSPFSVPIIIMEASPNPFIFDNINLDGELYLKVRVTRNGIVGEQDVFDNLFISLGAIADNTTSINIYGLKTGDQATLYQDNGSQIGSPLSVEDDSLPIVFADVPLLEERFYKIIIHREVPVSSTGTFYRSARDLILVWTRPEITDNGLETITIEYLEDGDVVNLYDSEGNAVAGKQGLPSGADGKVTISGLESNDYQVEVVRGTIRSHWVTVEEPKQNVNFWADISKNEMGEKQFRLYNLQKDDRVEIFKGSDGSAFMAPFNVTDASPSPLVYDNINLGGELYLKVRVTRNGLVGEQDIFDDLYIGMGAITGNNTTNITVYGLKTGDLISLYHGKGAQIGSTQIGDTSTPTMFMNVPILEEEGYRFEISRTLPVSSTGTTYRHPKDLVGVWCRPDINAKGLENLTMEYLESGDVVNLYDSTGNAIAGKQGLPAGADGKVTIIDLEPKKYQLEVVRGTIHSNRVTIDPPTPPLGVTDQPTITGTVRAGDISISGTASPGASIVLSVNGVAAPTVAADTGGVWTVTGLTLIQGDIISVTAQLAGELVSPVSVVTVITPDPDLTVTSTAFANGGPIPIVHVLSGMDNDYTVPEATNTSIPLDWGSAAPAGHSFFIIMTDIDAGNWNHWVVKNIPANLTSIDAGASSTCDQPGIMPAGSVELLNSWGSIDPFARGYYGPKPPQGTGPHRYEIQVFELDVPAIDTSDEGAGYSYEQLRNKIDSHITRSGKITGTYIAP